MNDPLSNYDRLAGSLTFEVDCLRREIADAQRAGDYETMLEAVAVKALLHKLVGLVEQGRQSFLAHRARMREESR